LAAIGVDACESTQERKAEPMTDTTLPRDSDGKLSAYAWPGGYPIVYLDHDNETLCPECARAEDANEIENFRPCSCFIHYEGRPEICSECNREIESAYGDPEAAE
jgi:hypothetical protein